MLSSMSSLSSSAPSSAEESESNVAEGDRLPTFGVEDMDFFKRPVTVVHELESNPTLETIVAKWKAAWETARGHDDELWLSLNR